MSTSKRFQYDKLNERQLRIAISLLNVETQITDALESAAQAAVNQALSTYEVSDVAEVSSSVGSVSGGARGGARGKRSKSSSSKTPTRRGKRASSSTPKLSNAAKLESRKLQGVYIAAIRRVPKSKRAQYKASPDRTREEAISAINRDYPKAN